MISLRTATLLIGITTQVFVPRMTHAGPQVQERAKAPDRVIKPFLWRIEGDTPNFIFGTVHVADPRALKLHPEVEKAFVNSDAAFFEIDFRRSADQLRAITLRDGEKLEDTLPAELIQRLDARINKYQPGYRNQFKAKPIIWPMVLPQLEAATRFQSPGLDQQLYARAMQTGKRVGGLEDPGTQLRDLFKLTQEEQVTFVRSTLDSMDKADAKKTDLLMQSIEFYLRGDGKAFHQFLLDDSKSLPEPLRTKFLTGLVYTRNTRIAREIKELVDAFPNRKHFFAVGTFHMLGDRSVLTELSKLKKTTTRVTE